MPGSGFTRQGLNCICQSKNKNKKNLKKKIVDDAEKRAVDADVSGGYQVYRPKYETPEDANAHIYNTPFLIRPTPTARVRCNEGESHFQEGLHR